MGLLESYLGGSAKPLVWLAALAIACIWVVQLYKTVRKVNAAAASFGQRPYTILTYCREYLRGILDFPGLLAEHYGRTNGERPFVVPNPMFGPIVMVTAKQVSAYRFASDSELNAQTALHKILQARFTLPDNTWDSGPSFHPVHLRKYLQRSLGPSTPDLAAEVNLAMERFWGVSSRENDWIEVELLSSILKIITQEVNKMYVGEEIGRETGYIDAVVGLATAVLTCGLTLNLVPLPLKSVASKVICWPARYRRRILVDRYLRDIVQRRKVKLEGKMPEKDNKNPEAYEDYCMALLSAAHQDKNPAYYETENFISRFMTHYVAAVYATSVTFLGVVEKLLQHPDVLKMLRDEAQSMLANPDKPNTWRKAEIDRLDIHDSFIRECMRTTPVAYATMRRSAIKPEGFTFGDGTFAPADFEVGVPVDQLHHDGKYYRNARHFDPLRFTAASMGATRASMDGEKPSESTAQKVQLATTTTSFLAWGDGTHACIGRFLAANILKTTLACLVLNYDIEPAENFSSHRRSFGIMNVPNRVSRVRLRRLQRQL